MFSIYERKFISMHNHVPRNEISMVDTLCKTFSKAWHSRSQLGEIPLWNLHYPGFHSFGERIRIFVGLRKFPIPVKIKFARIQRKQKEIAVNDFCEPGFQIMAFARNFFLHECAGEILTYVIRPFIPDSRVQDFRNDETLISTITKNFHQLRIPVDFVLQSFAHSGCRCQFEKTPSIRRLQMCENVSPRLTNWFDRVSHASEKILHIW